MNAKLKVIQEHNGSWWFCAFYGDGRDISFSIPYEDLDFYNGEGVPIVPNR